MNQPVPYVFEDNLVRVVDQEGEPWFVGKDVCQVLDIKKHHQALDRLDEDERGTCTVGTPSGDQAMIVVSEPGVFRLTFRSRKPEAERFKRWLAHEVLPALRRDGKFSIHETDVTDEHGEPFSITGESVAVVQTKLQLVRECRHLHGPARAKALWPAIGLPLVPVPAEGIDDARGCLEQLMLSAVDGGGMVQTLVYAALEDDTNAQLLLRNAGVFVQPDAEGIVVANKTPEITKIYEGTKWDCGHWARALRRLPGASRTGSKRFGPVTSRGTFIPEQQLDYERDDG